MKLEVLGIVEMKAYRVSATSLLAQIHQHEQRMTAGKVTLLTLTPPNSEPVWHGRAFGRKKEEGRIQKCLNC